MINWVTFIFDFGMGVGKTRNTEHSGTSRNMKKIKIIFMKKSNNQSIIIIIIIIIIHEKFLQFDWLRAVEQ